MQLPQPQTYHIYQIFRGITLVCYQPLPMRATKNDERGRNSKRGSQGQGISLDLFNIMCKSYRSIESSIKIRHHYSMWRRITIWKALVLEVLAPPIKNALIHEVSRIKYETHSRSIIHLFKPFRFVRGRQEPYKKHNSNW